MQGWICIYGIPFNKGGDILKKKLVAIMMLALFVFTTTACSDLSSLTGSKEDVIIDWVDFVKYKDQEYNAAYELVISNETFVEKKPIGKISFKVANVITDPGYETKNGDAAFLNKGTQIYAIKGISSEELIAVKSEDATNGYRLYLSREHRKSYAAFFDEMDANKITSIEIIRDENIITQLEDTRKNTFIALLKGGLNMENFVPDLTKGEPDTYHFVMYTADAISYQFDLYDDHKQFYFNPNETRILDEAVREFVSSG